MTDYDASSLYRFDPAWPDPPSKGITDPVLVVALEGWVDAGMGASGAIAELLISSPIAEVATFDAEPLIDQRARRPIARLEDGVTTAAHLADHPDRRRQGPRRVPTCCT